ncbi:hypothetical protein D1007_49254 [Hordeum vulgare]|nr:hypothetical protein D1007_49254 [Hordeum vulgare]
MALPGKKGKAVASSASAATAGPPLMPSFISKAEDLGPVLPFVARDMHEWGATAVWPGSAVLNSLVRCNYLFFLHNIYARLVPPFSDLFYAIISHYQIRALNPQPNFVLLLAIFSFYYKALMGMSPSVVLFHHFFSYRFTAQGRRSARISFVDV